MTARGCCPATMGAVADRDPGGDACLDVPMIARDLAGRLGLKRRGRAWRARCPACGFLDAPK
jgi:hypothetical protein